MVLYSYATCTIFFSDRTIKVWNFDGLSDDIEQPINLKAKAVVAAHDKDINSLAVAPNDSLVCSGSQVSRQCILIDLLLCYDVIDFSFIKRRLKLQKDIFSWRRPFIQRYNIYFFGNTFKRLK